MMRGMLFVGLLVGASSASQAQDTLLVPGDRDATAQLTRIVESTRDSGLPVDPILAKVHYGVLIAHAAPSRIVASARAIASRLEAARGALAPATANEIVAGADALGAGATKDALRAVRNVSGRQSVATPLGVLAQLLESRVPVDRATDIVTKLIKRGATADQLVALGTNVTSDVEGGAAAIAALDTRARFLSGVLAPAGAASTAQGLTSASSPKGKP